MNKFFIICATLILSGCSSEDTVTQKPVGTAPPVSQEKAVNRVRITPENATARSVITLDTGSPQLTNATIAWYINGNIAEPSGSSRFSSPKLRKGDIVQAVITRNKKEYYSNEIKIKNTPPRIKRAEMVPSTPRVGATLNIQTEAYDADGDTIYYKYKWRLNGRYISDQKSLNTDFRRDDMIVAEITPYDSDAEGNTIYVKNKIYNSLPVVSGNAPVFDGKTYQYALKASDPDGDELTYEIKEGPDGMTIDRYGNISWETGPEDVGTHKYTVIVSDNNGGEIVMPITTTIGFEE